MKLVRCNSSWSGSGKSLWMRPQLWCLVLPCTAYCGITMSRFAAERPKSEDELVQMLREDLAAEGIQDKYQHELYEKRGIEQIKGFLAACARAPVPKLLHLEEAFEIIVGGTTLAGRIDRIDGLEGGRSRLPTIKRGTANSGGCRQEPATLDLCSGGAGEVGISRWSVVFYNLKKTVQSVRGARPAVAGSPIEGGRSCGEDCCGRIEAKPGFYCTFCSYRNLCPTTEKRLFACRR